MLGVDQFASGIPGEYQIERLLGQSALGAAYLAYQPAQRRQVMITTFNLPGGISAQDYEQLRLRLVREEDVLVRLTHPHIVPVYSLGLQPRYLYLVTAFVKESSLGQFLKQNARFAPEQTLEILKQLVAGLEYAHSQGVTHGMLSLSHVMVNSALHMRIAGFGLRQMLEVHGNTQNNRPLAHLTSEYGTFLGSPEYISPERVLGLAVDPRSDIYALGAILFELLSGSQLFHGANPLDIALQRLQQPIPSIHAICPDVPAAFDLVLAHMLERDPAKRTQFVGEAVILFERVLKALNPEKWGTSAGVDQKMLSSDVTLPPTINWFDEPMAAPHQWERELPAQTGQLSASASSPLNPQENSSIQAGNNPHSLEGIDPFAWWTGTSTGLSAAASKSPLPGTFSQRTPVRMSSSKSSARQLPNLQGRRKLVKSIVVGTTVVGALTVGGITFARFTQSVKQAQVATGGSTAAGTTPGTGANPGKGSTPGAQPASANTPGAQGSPTVQATPQKQPTPTPQQQPTPTSPPGHTGTVIGSTNQAVNTAVRFTNPATGNSSFLIHLPGGNFVACERICTHIPAESAIAYVSSNQTLKCNAHGATFNALSNFAHTSGPGSGPLKSVSITVNADGTITA